jgi:phosphoserine phosphatase RsbU/P
MLAASRRPAGRGAVARTPAGPGGPPSEALASAGFLLPPELEDLLESLLARAPFGFAFLDRELRYIHINEFLADMNGLPVEAHLGRRMGDLFPELEAVTGRRLRDVLAGTPLLGVEMTGRPPGKLDERRHWVASYYPVRVGDEIVGAAAAIVDLTERKAAADALGRQARQQAAVAAFGLEALAEEQIAPLFTRAVSLLTEVLGVTHADVLQLREPAGLVLRGSAGWEDRVGEAVPVAPAHRQALDTAAAVVLGAPDGQPVPDWMEPAALASGLLVVIHGITAPFGLLGVYSGDPRGFTDDEVHFVQSVANVLGAAVDRRRAEQEVQGSELRLRLALESGRLGTWEWDAVTGKVTFSPTMERIFGYEPGTFPGTYEAYQQHLHPDERDWMGARVGQALADGGAHHAEHRIVTVDGSVRWIDGRGATLLGPEGEPTGMVGVASDITDRKRAEEERAALLAREQASGERFRRLAQTLQGSLLPPHLPAIEGLDVAAFYRPTAQGVQVGGDFYDLFPLRGRGWGVVVGDVCGKGPEAAALTALARYTVRTAAMQHRRPSRVVGVLNDVILQEAGESRFCTLAYGRMRAAASGVTFTFTSGGHPPPLVLRADGSVETHEQEGMLIGLFDDPDLRDATIELGPGDALVLYTDGVLDAEGSQGPFEEERLRAALAQCRGLVAGEVVRCLEAAVLSHSGGEAGDDLAVLVLRVDPDQVTGERVVRRVPG